MGMVTQFYLSKDPMDVDWILLYRRSLIYMPKVRWHLAILLGTAQPKVIPHYTHFLYNQTILLLNGIQEDSDSESSSVGSVEGPFDGVPLLSETEVMMIFDEKLEGFFGNKLGYVMSL